MKVLSNFKNGSLSVCLVCLLTLIACNSAKVVQEPGLSATGITIVDDVFSEVATMIGNRFYDHKKKSIIKFCLKDIFFDGLEESSIRAYIYETVFARLDSLPQFSLVPKNDFDLDCIVEVHIVHAASRSITRDAPSFDLFLLIKDANDTVIFEGIKKPLDAVFNSQAYLAFKESYRSQKNGRSLIQRRKTIRLLVEAANVGETYHHVERRKGVARIRKWDSERSASYSSRKSTYSRYQGRLSYRPRSPSNYYSDYPRRQSGSYSRYSTSRGGYDYSNRGSSEQETYSSRFKEYGSSGWYPAKHELYINRKKFVLNAENLFYNGPMRPGKLELYASFVGAFYDSKTNKQQFDKKRIIRKFEYNIEGGEDLKLQLVCLCKKEDKDIKMNIYKMKKTVNGPYIEKVFVPVHIALECDS